MRRFGSLSPPSVLLLLAALFATMPVLVLAPAGCSSTPPPAVQAEPGATPTHPTSQLDTVATVAGTLGWVLPSMRVIVPLLDLPGEAKMVVLATINQAIEVNRDLQAAVDVARRTRDRPWARCDTHALLARLKDHLLALARDLTNVGFAPPVDLEQVLGVLGGVEDALLGPCDPASPDVGVQIDHELTRLRATPRLRPFPPLDRTAHD